MAKAWNKTHRHTYIYSHPQRDCFVLSEHFSVAKHVGRSKPGSKPIQLYVRLSLRPLGHQGYHVWLRELLRYLCSNSSSRLFTFLYPIGYQSAQFFQRALHYANGGRKFLSPECSTPMGERILSYIYIWGVSKWIQPINDLLLRRFSMSAGMNLCLIWILNGYSWRSLKILCNDARERPSSQERLRGYFFRLLRTWSLTATTLSGHLAVNFLPYMGFSAFLLRLFTDPVT